MTEYINEYLFDLYYAEILNEGYMESIGKKFKNKMSFAQAGKIIEPISRKLRDNDALIRKFNIEAKDIVHKVCKARGITDAEISNAFTMVTKALATLPNLVQTLTTPGGWLLLLICSLINFLL